MEKGKYGKSTNVCITLDKVRLASHLASLGLTFFAIKHKQVGLAMVANSQAIYRVPACYVNELKQRLWETEEYVQCPKGTMLLSSSSAMGKHCPLRVARSSYFSRVISNLDFLNM